MDDKVIVRTMFTKLQPFKGVEKYFTGSLLHKENGKVIKKSLSDDIDSDNEADSKSGKNPTVSFDD